MLLRMPVASALRAEKVIAERNRGGTPLRGPARLITVLAGGKKTDGDRRNTEYRQSRSKSMRKSSAKSGAGAQQ